MTINPEPGQLITWNGIRMRVTRLGLPTFPGGRHLVYAQNLKLGNDTETFIPDGEWTPVVEADPEPQWLASLSRGMRGLVGDVVRARGMSSSSEEQQILADRATDLAAAYLHPVHEELGFAQGVIADLREQGRTQAACVTERDAEILRPKATVKSGQTRIGDLEFDLRRQEEVVQGLRSENADRLKELEALDDAGRPLQYLPLSEVTDGHIAAFANAYAATGQGDIVDLAREAVRAGLAAIQWPSTESTPPGNGGKPDVLRERVLHYSGYDLEPGEVEDILRSLDAVTDPEQQHDPGMREVPLTAARDGDRVTIDGYFHGYNDDMTAMFVGTERGATVVEVDLELIGRDGTLNCVTVTRPVPALPDKPGAVGTATVRGTKGVRVFRTGEGNGPPHWNSAELVDGLRWHLDSDLSDYVPLLDGQEG